MNPDQAKTRLFPLLALMLLVQAAIFLLRPVVTYEGLSLGLSGFELGLLGAVFAIIPMFLALPLGSYIDRGRHGIVVLGGLITAVLAAFALATGSGLTVLVIANALLGIGYLSVVMGLESYVAVTTSRESLVRIFGHLTLSASAGQALGPAALAIASDGQALATGRAVLLGMGLTFASLALLPFAGALFKRSQGFSRRGPWGPVLTAPGVVPAVVVGSILLSVVDVTLIYLPILGEERGISPGTVGALLAARAVASAVTRLGLHRMARWLGADRLMQISIAILAVSFLLILLPLSPAWVLGVLVIQGLALGAGQPLVMARITLAAPRGANARVMSLRLAANRFGQVVLPVLAGTLVGVVGVSGVFALTGLAVAAASPAYRRSVKATGEDPPHPG